MDERQSKTYFKGSLIPLLLPLKEQGRWGEITGRCIKLLDFCPEDIQTRSLLAEAYLEMGFLCSAEQEYRLIEAESKGLSDVCKMRLASFHPEGNAPDLPDTHEGIFDQEEGLSASELATPTIAELYLSQGRKAEAIAIYEKTLAACPHDNAVRKRLAEIQGLLSSDESPEIPDEETHRIVYLTAVLEDWLKKIRNRSNAG